MSIDLEFLAREKAEEILLAILTKHWEAIIKAELDCSKTINAMLSFSTDKIKGEIRLRFEEIALLRHILQNDLQKDEDVKMAIVLKNQIIEGLINRIKNEMLEESANKIYADLQK